MLKKLFDQGETSKMDVAMYVAAAAVAIYKAFDKYFEYKNQEKS